MKKVLIEIWDKFPDPPHFRTRGWLQAYDPEAADGEGYIELTFMPEMALKFPNLKDAIDFCNRVPENKPLREDGKPNKPLTIFSLQYIEMRLN